MLALISFALSNWRVFAIGAAALVLAGWAWHEHDTLIAQGAAQERAQMEAANAAALEKANQAATDVDACYRRGAGYTWDRTLGVCVSSPASKPAVRRHR